MVDAEGFDYEILQGGSDVIRRARYLMFEVNTVGTWKTHSVIELVHTKLKDYNCDWAGKGKLWRITDCWDYSDLEDLYDLVSWSNIACVRHSEVELTCIMEEVFEKSL